MELTQISESGFQSRFRHYCVTLDMLLNLCESEFLSFLKNEVKLI